MNKGKYDLYANLIIMVILTIALACTIAAREFLTAWVISALIMVFVSMMARCARLESSLLKYLEEDRAKVTQVFNDFLDRVAAIKMEDEAIRKKHLN